ncbi:tRNA-binding protein [Dyella caseinilytica]|uniref:tRNA-binding protein n=1 Tax=Dyella caseinilytica TaxID=1849581 RepID=A0ABX7GY96_9GAMM|nr:tRNA-binding protein [Dyella caseinilytica]QRN55431.1 tRNA-binding protein [Dyella caseinilytica]GGA01646.1 tRNA-binding protein [Dyella caseinilytica]
MSEQAAVEEISWADFQKVMIVAGTVTRVEPFPEARKPAWKVWVDFGPYGERKTSAQIAALYTPESLIGRQIVGIINFPEKQIGPFRSQFLLTGFHTEQGVVITTVERPVPNGARLS